MAKFNPTFGQMKSKSAVGYSAFPLDHLVNFTSAAGYLIPVFWDFLDPGDKVNFKTLLRTKTQPLTKPAMATCIERVEWFAVPIDQLYKPFGAKYYGINDISTDLLPTKGYDDYLPYIQLTKINDVISSLPTTPEAQSAVPVSLPLAQDSMRLCQSFGVPKLVGLAANQQFPAAISALPFAAYQKIYSDHYRLTDREENDPAAYNLDSFVGSSGNQSANITDNTRIQKLITLRKRPYMRDYFTSMSVSPLMGRNDIGSSGTELIKLSQWLSGITRLPTGVPSEDYSSQGYEENSVVNPTDVKLPFNAAAAEDGLQNVSAANIRSMFAVEKLLEVTRRAKKHYDMQTLAHFGVEVPKGLSGECFKLGTHEQYLQIGEVISSANTSEGSLGELAGRGNSEGSSKNFDFEAKCHCVLMAIYSVEPVVNIGSDGVPRLLSMTNASDFFKSEFDNLGLQPVFRKELYAGSYNAETVSDNNYNTVIGWQPRYEQLKGRYNRSFAGCDNSYFSEWALNRTSIGNTAPTVSRNFFYVWPTDLNNILLQNYNFATPQTLYSQDYFVNQIYFDVTKSSKKSIFGVPNL